MKSHFLYLSTAALLVGTGVSAQQFQYDGTTLGLSYSANTFGSGGGEEPRVSALTAVSYGNFGAEAYLAYSKENYQNADFFETNTAGLRFLYSFSDAFAVGIYGQYNTRDREPFLVGFTGPGNNNTSHGGIEMRGDYRGFDYVGYFGASNEKNTGGEDWYSTGLHVGRDFSNGLNLFAEVQYDNYQETTTTIEDDVTAVKLGMTYDIGSALPSVNRPIYLKTEVGRLRSDLLDETWTQGNITVSIPLGRDAPEPPAFRGKRSLATESPSL
ncbi:MAG: hypothetical protein CML55_09470 [Rhodobacteraceae bacterium]|nr:hypothetical protein [Paracoccaceae bacterium]MBO29243.1 hypothetical protein [Paracoccaceae bacterium]